MQCLSIVFSSSSSEWSKLRMYAKKFMLQKNTACWYQKVQGKILNNLESSHSIRSNIERHSSWFYGYMRFQICKKMWTISMCFEIFLIWRFHLVWGESVLYGPDQFHYFFLFFKFMASKVYRHNQTVEWSLTLRKS